MAGRVGASRVPDNLYKLRKGPDAAAEAGAQLVQAACNQTVAYCRVSNQLTYLPIDGAGATQRGWTCCPSPGGVPCAEQGPVQQAHAINVIQ